MRFPVHISVWLVTLITNYLLIIWGLAEVSEINVLSDRPKIIIPDLRSRGPKVAIRLSDNESINISRIKRNWVAIFSLLIEVISQLDAFIVSEMKGKSMIQK